MPGQRGSEKRKATELLPPLRLTPEQKALVLAYADREGATVTEYARSRILQVPTSRARPVPSVDEQGLTKAIGLLGRVSGNLYQLLRAVRFGGYFDEAEIATERAAIRVTCRAIMEALGREP